MCRLAAGPITTTVSLELQRQHRTYNTGSLLPHLQQWPFRLLSHVAIVAQSYKLMSSLPFFFVSTSSCKSYPSEQARLHLIQPHHDSISSLRRLLPPKSSDYLSHLLLTLTPTRQYSNSDSPKHLQHPPLPQGSPRPRCQGFTIHP